ncbi:DUF4271 domain-containing protein [Persicitalea jodogahamensis]|uniref:DUF4271 domain-containing protein n=1 Tax=Persicitalea jodogahamensis TaxID=402147 RepID=A0A8J3D6N3_9BACT|nr:DUF4271 domain-containing protein [Persicitalea jodogahamensis]GHB60940.1 hypothetical protein GCM10007390_13350 [Persicitalea jodogahamensis]
MKKSLRLFKAISLFWLAGSLFSAALAEGEVGPDGRYYLVRDLKNDWLAYSQKYQNYVPFSRGVNETEMSASLLIDLLQNRRYDLLISSTRQNYLFIEGALQSKLTPNTWLTLDIDSLQRVYRKTEILITLYGSPGIEDKTALIGHARRVDNTSAETKQNLPIINIKPLRTTPFEDFSIVVLLFLLIFTLFTYSSSPSVFRRFVRPNDFFDKSPRNDFYNFTKPYTPFSVMIAMFVSTGMAYLILFLIHFDLEIFYAAGLLSEGDTLADLLLDQVKLMFACLGLFFLKYLWMSLVGSVLNLGKTVNTHYVKALQISYMFYAFNILAFFALLLPNPQWLELARPYLIYGFVFYYSVRVLVLYLFSDNTGKVINLYLFSYLCVVEIVPIIIGVKFAI